MSVNQAVDQALAEVLWHIPREILNVVFEPTKKAMTLDECIIEEVINFKVLRDVNLYSGIYKLIPLDRCKLLPTPIEPGMTHITDIYSGLFEVPPDVRDYKEITKVISVELPFIASHTDANPYIGTRGGSVQGALRATLNSHSPENTFVAPTPVFKGNNIIQLAPGSYTHYNWQVQCRLGYDQEFRGMNDSSVAVFSEMVREATRILIHVRRLIPNGTMFVMGGAELGPFKDYSDSCADAAEKYESLRREFLGTEHLTPEVFARLVQMAL